MSDIMISFEYTIKKNLPFTNLEKEEDGVTYKCSETAKMFWMFCLGWNAGERG